MKRWVVDFLPRCLIPPPPSPSITFLALNVAIVQAVPPEASGVAGALLQVALQIGAVIGLSVQAGLYSLVDGNLAEWRGTQYGFWFLLAWMALTGLLVLAFYRPQKSAEVLATVNSRETKVNPASE